MLTSTLGEGLFGGGLVDEVLFCCGDSLEEDLRWEPRLGVFVALVELDDDVEIQNVQIVGDLMSPIIKAVLRTRTKLLGSM